MKWLPRPRWIPQRWLTSLRLRPQRRKAIPCELLAHSTRGEGHGRRRTLIHVPLSLWRGRAVRSVGLERMQDGGDPLTPDLCVRLATQTLLTSDSIGGLSFGLPLVHLVQQLHSPAVLDEVALPARRRAVLGRQRKRARLRQPYGAVSRRIAHPRPGRREPRRPCRRDLLQLLAITRRRLLSGWTGWSAPPILDLGAGTPEAPSTLSARRAAQGAVVHIERVFGESEGGERGGGSCRPARSRLCDRI